MKKLRLYGEKKIFLGFLRRRFIADIFVDQNNVCTVESKNFTVKKELLAAINELGRNNEIILRKGVIEGNTHTSIGETKKPGDKDFLIALKEYRTLWRDRRFGGYKIFSVKSKIIDE